MKTIFVIPTYNEADNLPVIVKALMELELRDLHLLIVDDNSPDGTGQIADHLATVFDGRIFVMHRQGKEGLGRAYVAGFTWALEHGYDAIGEMDADLSHDPKSVPDLVARIAGGADVVLGSRYLNGISVINWPLRRILLSLGANEYVRRITRIPIHDGTSGFRVYARQALEAINLPTIRSNGYSFQVEMSYRACLTGCEIVEEPIVFTERHAGESKMSRGVIMESALMPWRLRANRGKLLKTVKQLRRDAQAETV
ncbi:MAG: polyprenol monophosphomannose synthase [Capsulimonadaceae bacterium]|nr:polyprenol monophosphomannose synthase [Capsulimonadaceae bacterium]